ncbi:CusA/CzcA family heavy metal efflux RND transporter [Sporocytophaga myxococcoides]|uniref:CusA/CzcA family heavy metal efflux RND transporter n=1 Tax=Sporocytophaga myxococcoides TaxID=153721 RepID=UPI0005EEC9F3|nr:CusA/CzcA family heavy metal efflux RND transporter [Sporocytophaga myxococcoides]
MIDSLISFSIRNKIIIGFFTIALIFWGLYSLSKLPIDAVPDITNNQVQVITSTPTLAAQEVEKFITFPIELSMANIPKLVQIRSISRFGLSVVTVVFEDGADVYWARQQISERLKTAQGQIPPGIGVPELAPITTGLGEIYQYVLRVEPGYEKKYSAMDLRTIQDWTVKRQLLGTSGIADVSSFGGYLKQYEVSINPEKLRSMNVTFSEIFNALSRNNQNTGGAYINKDPNSYFIRGIGLVTSLEDIQKISIKEVNGIPLLIRDVANVDYGSAIRYGAMTKNNEGEVVGGIVLMLKGSNSAKVIENVKERIKNIEKNLPKGISIEPFIDRSKLVNKAIHTVSKNLIEGGLIVIFVLVLFLGNIRAGLVVASVIPLSMLFAFSMMNIFGVSGNLMSLGAIDFGLIVDGAVIIVEAIVHNITLNKELLSYNKLSRSQMDVQVFLASTKIRKSAAFGEIIILMVYIPILSLEGIEGKMFRPMAETVSFAILGALILSLTYVPMASALLLSRKTAHKRNISDRFMDAINKFYEPIIEYTVKHKGLVIVIAVSFLVVAILLFTRLGGQFVPTLEEGDFAVETRILPGSSLNQTIKTSLQASEILLKQFPEVNGVVGKIGTSEIPIDPMSLESNDLIIMLKEKDEWKNATTQDELAEKMSKALSAIPGLNTSFQQPIQMRFNELITGTRQDIAIKIFGDDLDVLAEKANTLASIAKGVQGAADIYVERVIGLPQIIVTYKRNKIAQYGISVEELNRIVRMAFAGEAAGIVYEGDKRFDLVVRLKEKFRQDINNIKELYIPIPTGAQIPITEVATIEFKSGPMQISREQTKRRITVGVNVRNRDVESLVNEIKQKADLKLKLAPGYSITYGGQFENLQEAKKRLYVVVPIALGLILMLLYFTFNSFKETLLIFTAIPFSAIGGIIALTIRGMPFSISAGIGFIALSGVAVLNGIVLISNFNILKKEGVEDVEERVLKGTKLRLRPVLMTATVASLGFFPMAISTSAGAEVQKPLATVVIGGLISATLLTLLVLPVLYIYFMKEKKKDDSGSSSNSYISIFFLLILGSFFYGESSSAQNIPQPLSIEQAIDFALRNNASVQSMDYELQSLNAIKRTSFDLSRTNMTFQYGQYNSIFLDNSFNFVQDFSLPQVYINQAKVNQANLEIGEKRMAITQNDLIKNVKSSYYQLLYLQSKRKFLFYEDSLFAKFAEATSLKFKTGESNYLEQVTAQTQLMEVRNLLSVLEADIIIAEKQLQVLLNTREKIVVSDIPLSKLDFPLISDSINITGNPYLGYAQKQIIEGRRRVSLERSRLLPYFAIGYLNQSLKGPGSNKEGKEVYYPISHRFQTVQVSLIFPLWYRPYRARIQASQLYEKALESNFSFVHKNIEGEMSIQLQQITKFQKSLLYYERNALPNSDLIINNGNIAYRSGEISYLEYLQSLTRALIVKASYLDYINYYNQSIIIAQYLIGEK